MLLIEGLWVKVLCCKVAKALTLSRTAFLMPPWYMALNLTTNYIAIFPGDETPSTLVPVHCSRWHISDRIKINTWWCVWQGHIHNAHRFTLQCVQLQLLLQTQLHKQLQTGDNKLWLLLMVLSQNIWELMCLLMLIWLFQWWITLCWRGMSFRTRIYIY